MDRHSFRTRFKLHQLNHDIPSIFTGRESLQAAVLIPLIEIESQLNLILTQRPMHLRHHPGQISFPGGKVEQVDSNLVATALREADEEIGLKADNVEVLGAFPSHHTMTGFEVTPVIGMVKQPFSMKIDSNEVADCFTAPLSYFIDNNNRHTVDFQRKGTTHKVHVMPYQDKFIWGITAAVINMLCQHISDS
ncbi:CoA pyrophosphatase [Shewanella maritima]|uniref:CoA pyrophosphatase n=1 Tax=Shewanella maritima TaxID=2520507 RepID=A0A411PDF2_9GAMM|nr:CoA pyrophosphatase [Shewanella maritima]QBF81544.1 CoA pyrophosphatase [Shewanella maritima]